LPHSCRSLYPPGIVAAWPAKSQRRQGGLNGAGSPGGEHYPRRTVPAGPRHPLDHLRPRARPTPGWLVCRRSRPRRESNERLGAELALPLPRLATTDTAGCVALLPDRRAWFPCTAVVQFGMCYGVAANFFAVILLSPARWRRLSERLRLSGSSLFAKTAPAAPASACDGVQSRCN
jgi:hypothetical protein